MVHLLKSFAALAGALHFTRAAAELGVTQPALSKHIQQLEEELGVRLFDRDRRTVRLTRAGELLVAPARQVLEAERVVRLTAKQIVEGVVGRIHVGVTPGAPHHVLPSVIAAFRRRHPGVAALVTESGSEELVAAVRAGEIDVAIVRWRQSDPVGELVCTPFFEEPLVAALPRDHRLATRRALKLSDLAGESFAMVSRAVAPWPYDELVSRCRAAGFSPRVVQEARDVHAVTAIVALGSAVAVVPRSASSLHLPNLVYRPLEGKDLKTSLWLAHRRRGASALIHDFVLSAEAGVARGARRTRPAGI